MADTTHTTTHATVKPKVPLEKGDIVCLPVVNAPLMSVTQVYANGDVRCEWFDQDQHHCERVFPDAFNTLEIDEAFVKAKEQRLAKEKADADAAEKAERAKATAKAAEEPEPKKKPGGHG